MRRRRDRVTAFGDHSCFRNIAGVFLPRQMTADARFCPLADLDLNGRAGLKIIGMNTETAGSHLHDGMIAVRIEILMEAAFTGVIEDPQLFGGFGQTGVGVVADGAVGHGGEHHRHGEFQIGRQRIDDAAVFVAEDLTVFLTEERFGFHRFP